jgi:hypothetical protein
MLRNSGRSEILGGVFALLQALAIDGLSFDPLSIQQNGSSAIGGNDDYLEWH